MIISEEDGRESLVDLTKTLCDMGQRGKLSSEEVTVGLIDAEVKGLICYVNMKGSVEN
jgi:dehydrodolichyl diphosphate syntase complex subunit NUS1